MWARVMSLYVLIHIRVSVSVSVCVHECECACVLESSTAPWWRSLVSSLGHGADPGSLPGAPVAGHTLEVIDRMLWGDTLSPLGYSAR